ncbi:hypothetical protein [Moritella yayanosii]|uniref:Uncharacterized protein n=1 Tax=Moritella yayanosii TaxID=69539 RepID=A0A330LW70_9GAMM|nr:hypothetical protein [Moritella yayanosii]SQD78315.1 protein of unknown function [Moritella yayanosii]
MKNSEDLFTKIDCVSTSCQQAILPIETMDNFVKGMGFNWVALEFLDE